MAFVGPCQRDCWTLKVYWHLRVDETLDWTVLEDQIVIFWLVASDDPLLAAFRDLSGASSVSDWSVLDQRPRFLGDA